MRTGTRRTVLRLLLQIFLDCAGLGEPSLPYAQALDALWSST